ncbi:helix-turn-helix domain-containing protein [Rhodococcus erythropolis]|nr:helix-turn-helix domain-containing protein [Rhodococcus erythropolis]
MRNHYRGHQCEKLWPLRIQQLGGHKAACRKLCQLRLDMDEALNLPLSAYNEPDAPVPQPVYGGIAAWTSAEHWIETDVRTAYAEEYKRIRPQLINSGAKNGQSAGGGISLKSLLAVAICQAAYADFKTGRNSYVSVERIMKETGLGERTVQRARKTLILLGVGTEVLRGRLRTKQERLESHEVGDHYRGWTSVFALHPRRPVDKTRSSDGRYIQMAPHPLRGISKRFKSPLRELNTPKQEERAASRRIDTKAEREKAEGLRKGSLLAVQWLRNRRTPDWARQFTVKTWSHALAKPAVHGWIGDDLNSIILDREHTRGISPKPDKPLGFMRWLLNSQDLNFPPHVLDRIAHEQQRAEREQRAADFEAERARRADAAGPDSPGRRAAMAAVPKVADARRRRAITEAQAAERARAEISRLRGL